MQRFGFLFGCILFSTALAQADLSIRECIKAPTGGRWELPGDSQWRTVSSLDFNNILSSDIVAQAAITYHEGSGQAGVRVEYQLVLDGISSFTMQHRPNTGFPTTKMLRASFPDVAAGQHTLQLRARSTSTFSAYFAQAWITPLLVQARTIGGATTFAVRRLFSQSMPGDLTVYEGSASNVTIPADATWHTIASSPPTVLAAPSSGVYGTKGFGFATVTYNGAYNNEALLRFLFMFTTPWEIGTVHVHGTGGKTVMEGLISDWEKLGFTPGGSYSVQLNAIGDCSSASSLSAKSARFQIVVLPDNDGFVTPYICPSNPQDCCPVANGCTVYNCNAGTLATVSSPGIDCPIPP